MMTRQMLISIVLCLFSKQVLSQASVNATFVDTFLIWSNHQASSVLVGFLDEGERTSILRVNKSSGTTIYKDVLPCYTCKEKNALGYTYAGYSRNGNVVGFCSVDFLGVDTTYVDFNQTPPRFLKKVHRAYDRQGESYELRPRKNFSVNDFSVLTGSEFDNAIETKILPWVYPFGSDLSFYIKNGSWLPHIVIVDSVTLDARDKIYYGFDKRDWCTIILWCSKGKVRHYRNILYADIDGGKKFPPKLNLKSLKKTGNIVVFVQCYSSFKDSIFIDFSGKDAKYNRVVHVSNKSGKVERTLIEPKVPFPIEEARTLFGDVYVFPVSRRSDWIFRKY